MGTPMSKTSSISSGETKQDDTPLHYLGTKLIPFATTKEELTPTDLGRWTAIFSYLHFNEEFKFRKETLASVKRMYRSVFHQQCILFIYYVNEILSSI